MQETAFMASNHITMRLARGIITLLKDRALAAKPGANAGATVLVNFEWR